MSNYTKRYVTILSSIIGLTLLLLWLLPVNAAKDSVELQEPLLVSTQKSDSSMQPQQTDKTTQAFLPLIMGGTVSTDEVPTIDENDLIHDDEYLAELTKDEPAWTPDEGQQRAAVANNMGGLWGPVIAWPHTPVSVANLPDGRILTFSGSERESWPDTDQTHSAIWDPVNGSFVESLYDGHNMFCGSLNSLPDGSLLTAGGRSVKEFTSYFNPATETWSRLPNMNSGRWYPGTVVLPDASVVTMVGRSSHPYAERWRAGEDWTLLTGINLEQAMMSYGTRRNGFDMWPLLHLDPRGNIFHHGAAPNMHIINPRGNGSITEIGPSAVDWNASQAVDIMYDEGKILVTGGGRAGDAKAIIFDITTSTPQITTVAGMNHPRKFQNEVMLPTGDVLVIGGNTSRIVFSDQGSILIPELWNPDTKTWTDLNPMSVPRNYHSTAILLPDGRVLSAGGGYKPRDPDSPVTHTDGQVFSPPYLFKPDGTLAERPIISSAPTVVATGQNFTIKSATDIVKFSIIRMSATTHTYNTDLRYLEVPFTKSSNDTYNLTAHANENVLLPGYWMLFAINSDGVPSKSAIIQFQMDDSTPGGPTPGNQDLVVNEITTQPSIAGTSVSYNGSAEGGNAPQFRWLFGDGTPQTAFSTSSSVSHTFAQPGRYAVTLTVKDSSGQEKSTQFYQAIYRNKSANQPNNSSSIAYETRNGNNRLWNVNPDNDTISVFNSVTNNKVAEIAVGKNPRSLAIAPNGQVWVSNHGSASISVINSETLRVGNTIALAYGSRPFGVVFDPAGNNGYVALEATGQLLKLNSNNRSIISSVDVGPNPRHLAISADGSKVYVSRFITPRLPGEDERRPQPRDANGQFVGGEVLVVTTANMGIANTIVLALDTFADSEAGARGVPNYLGATVISPDGGYAWVPSKEDNVMRGKLRDNQSLNFEHTVRAISSYINLNTNNAITRFRLDHDNSSLGSAGAFGPNGNYYFAALESSREIVVIDSYARTELFRFDVGRAPQGLVVSPNSQRLYVHNFMDRTIGVYNLSQLIDGGTFNVNLITTYNSVASETLSGQVLNGKQLFYDARDQRLADDAYMSCAACHNGGGHDGRVWDFTDRGEGLRNTISLEGHGNATALHWSGNFDEVHDFENQIRTLAGGTGLMTNNDFNATSTTLGATKAGRSSELDSLAAYVRSLTSYGDSPFRESNGQLTAAGQAGEQIFMANNCAACHGGTDFSDSAIDVRHNVGTLTTFSGMRLGENLDGLDTPTLRGLWLTAPYLHNGSADTLTDAINAHSGTNISGPNMNNLVSYLLQIDDAAQQPVNTQSTPTPVPPTPVPPTPAPPTPTAPAPAPTPPGQGGNPVASNVALGKTATASSQLQANLSADQAVDGDVSTRWASLRADPQWIQVDLANTYNISRVVLRWTGSYAKTYRVEVSDDASSWTTIYTTSNGDGVIDNLTNLSGRGRYIRIYGTERGVNEWSYVIRELEVYGSQ